MDTLKNNHLAKQLFYGIDFSLQHSMHGKNNSQLPSTGLSGQVLFQDIEHFSHLTEDQDPTFFFLEFDKCSVQVPQLGRVSYETIELGNLDHRL